MYHKLFPIAVLIGSNLVFIANARALPGDNFQPHIYATIINDSNLFRVKDDTEAQTVTGSTTKDDTIQQINAGFKLSIPISRQDLVLKAEANKASYKNFNELDHTSSSGQATWNWEIGNNWNGTLGGMSLKNLTSFYEFQSVSKDMKKESNIYASVGYLPHPDWRLIGGISQQGADFQKRPSLKKRSQLANLEVQYKSTANTYIGIRSAAIDSEYPNHENISGTFINNNYNEREFSLVAYWEGTGKSHFSGRLGRTHRNHEDLTERNYSGNTGRLTYKWLISGATTLNLSLWRETESRDNEITTFAITNGTSVNPVWNISPKITIHGTLKREKIDYKGENIAILSSSAIREDEVDFMILSLDYHLRDNIGLSLRYQQEKRYSNQSSNEFQNNMITGSLSVNF